MAQRIVGLDIGAYSIKAVVLESTYRGWELIGFHEKKLSSEYIEAAPMIEHQTPNIPEGEEEETATTETQPDDEDIIEEETNPPDSRREMLRLALSHFMQKYGADWDTVFTALDGDAISLRMLNLPFGEIRKIDQTIGFTLEDVLPFPLEGKIVDYQLLNTIRESKNEVNTSLLAGIISHEAMEDYLSLFDEAGKKPKEVIIDSLALGNLFEQLADENHVLGSHALIDIGHRKTSICIVEDAHIAYVRTIPLGGQELTKALVNAFDLEFELAERGKHAEGFVRSSELKAINTDQEAIAQALEKALAPLVLQINLTFKAYTAKSRKQIETVSLTGGGSKLNNLPSYLSETLSIPVSPFMFLKSEFNRLADTSDVEANMATGLGMAFAGLHGSRMKRLNFRKGDFAFKGDFELWKGRLLHAGLNMLIVFFFFVFNVWSQFHVLEAEENRVLEDISKICKQTLGVEIRDAKICTAQMMEVIGKGGSDVSKMKPEISKLKIYDELVYGLTAEETNVNIDDMEISEKRIKVKGDVDTHQMVDKMVDNLKKFECFRNINKGPTKRKATNNRIQFSLNIPIECGSKKMKTKDAK